MPSKKATSLRVVEPKNAEAERFYKALPGYEKEDMESFIEKMQAEAQAKLLEKNLITMGDDATDNQSAFYAISYLLDWGSNSGNDPLEGWAAFGLSKLVQKLARDSQQNVAHEKFLRDHLNRKKCALEDVILASKRARNSASQKKGKGQ